jgi:hypothetical protein
MDERKRPAPTGWKFEKAESAQEETLWNTAVGARAAAACVGRQESKRRWATVRRRWATVRRTMNFGALHESARVARRSVMREAKR